MSELPLQADLELLMACDKAIVELDSILYKEDVRMQRRAFAIFSWMLKPSGIVDHAISLLRHGAVDLLG